MMHSAIPVFLSMLLMVFLPLSLHMPDAPTPVADVRTYTLEALDMSVSIPANLVTFTRDMDAKDPNLAAYGFTKDHLYSIFLLQNIYLNAWNDAMNFEVVITMSDSIVDDFNLLSEPMLFGLIRSGESERAAYGLTLQKMEIHQHAQAKFIKIYQKLLQKDTEIHILQYYTSYAGKAINITMRSMSDVATTAREALIQRIVDSAAFGTAPQHRELVSLSTGTTIHTDPKTGTKFTVPANWMEQPLLKERKYIDIKFVAVKDEGVSILYGSQDLWSQLPPIQQWLNPRSSIDNTLATEEFISEMYGTLPNQITTVSYGGVEYFKIETMTTEDILGIDLPIKMTHFLFIDQGYMYNFYFSGTSDSAYYKDLEALLESVEYNQVH